MRARQVARQKLLRQAETREQEARSHRGAEIERHPGDFSFQRAISWVPIRKAVQSGSGEFGWPLLQESVHALAKILGGAGLALAAAFEIELLFVGVPGLSQ